MRRSKALLPIFGLAVLVVSFQNCAKKDFQTGNDTSASKVTSVSGSAPVSGIDPSSPLSVPAYAFCSPFASAIRMLNQPVDTGASDVTIQGAKLRVSVPSAAAVDIHSLSAISVDIAKSESVKVSSAAAGLSIVTRNLISIDGWTGEVRANAVTVGSLQNFAALWVAVNADTLTGSISSAASNFCMNVRSIQAGVSIHDVAGAIVLISRRSAPSPNPVLAQITRVASPIILENVDVDDISDFAGIVILINSHVKHIGRGAALIWARNSIIDKIDDGAIGLKRF